MRASTISLDMICRKDVDILRVRLLNIYISRIAHYVRLDISRQINARGERARHRSTHPARPIENSIMYSGILLGAVGEPRDESPAISSSAWR